MPASATLADLQNPKSEYPTSLDVPPSVSRCACKCTDVRTTVQRESALAAPKTKGFPGDPFHGAALRTSLPRCRRLSQGYEPDDERFRRLARSPAVVLTSANMPRRSTSSLGVSSVSSRPGASRTEIRARARRGVPQLPPAGGSREAVPSAALGYRRKGWVIGPFPCWLGRHRRVARPG